jgi:hypothetical protein
MSHPPPGGGPSRGRHLRHPRRGSPPRSPPGSGSASSARTARARRRSCGSPPGSTSPTRGTVARKGLTLGLLEPGSALRCGLHGLAGPASRGPAGRRPPGADGERLAHLERDGQVAGHAYSELQHRFEVLGGYTLDQRVDEALSGLGFDRDEWPGRQTALSGGQQTRAALARLVIADPDLLLLDEPTNHLDLGALEWLEEHLRRRQGALLAASHDRAFLDATVTPNLGAARPEAHGVPRRLHGVSPPARRARRSGWRGRPRPTRERSPGRWSSSSGTAASAST